MSNHEESKQPKPNHLVEFEEVSRTLEAVAMRFPDDSAERRAVELATKALLYVAHQKVAVEFQAFLQTFDADITPEQKLRLQALGIKV